MENVDYRSVVKLQHPFSLLLAGPSGCGKTVFVGELIRRCTTRIDPPIKQVIYVYHQPQTYFENIAQRCPVPIKFLRELDAVHLNTAEATLLVVDDFMGLKSNDAVENLVPDYFIRRCHHENVSIAYLCQNLFNASKTHRTISLNSSYLFLGKNPRAVAQIQYLASQMYPGKTHFLRESYKDATSKPYGYLFLDFKQSTPEQFRVRTDILDGEPVIYTIKPN